MAVLAPCRAGRDRAFAQAVGEAISTWRAISRAVCSVASVVRRCAISQTLRAEDAENHHDGSTKDRDLLLAQAHCRDRITDPPKPAKLADRLLKPPSCARDSFIAY